MISIQCDEHIKSSIINGLKARAIQAYSVEENNLKGFSDTTLLQYCIKTNRILLTNDEDFLELSNKYNYPGIIFITTQFSPIGDIIRAVIKLNDTLSQSEFKNSKFFIP